MLLTRLITQAARLVVFLLPSITLGPATFAEEVQLRFDTDYTGPSVAGGPVVEPWRCIHLDPTHSGAWIVAGDVNGDGNAEIVSARNVDHNDVHYTSAVAAHGLDGRVLWRWGDPTIGRKELHHDVACQIHDWDGDGRNEVVVLGKNALVELVGTTGKERRHFSLPKDATDCLVFADLSGKGHPSDVLVKTRYSQVWAFTYEGKQLWTVKMPGGFRTSHQPVPLDIDSDGRDEVLAGNALLNADGSIRWVLKSEKVDIHRGHIDCWRVVRKGKTPRDFRLVATYCGANGLAMVDGNGRILWEAVGHHFESVDIGKTMPDVPGLQIVVDIDHRPWGEGPIWVFNEQGKNLGRIMTDYARHHALIDWTGDGIQEILVAQGRALYDDRGRRIATFSMEQHEQGADGRAEMLAMTGDMSGDGIPDVVLTTRDSSAVYIYKNYDGKKPDRPTSLGTGVNFTLY